MDKWAKILQGIYLIELKRDRRKAIAARRDHYRWLQGLRIIYSHIHEIRIPESEYEPDQVRDSRFIKDTLHPMERKEMQQI